MTPSRNLLSPCRIYLRGVTSDDVVSDMIRAKTHSKISHVEYLLDADWHDLIFDNASRSVVKAQAAKLPVVDFGTLGAHLKGGVAIRTTDYAVFSFVHHFHVEATWAEKLRVMAAALACVGDHYSIQAIADCLLECNVIRPKEYDCSWFVNDTLAAGGLGLQRTSDGAALITPRDCVMSPLAIPD